MIETRIVMVPWSSAPDPRFPRVANPRVPAHVAGIASWGQVEDRGVTVIIRVEDEPAALDALCAIPGVVRL